MVLKTMKSSVLVSAFVAASSLALVACGDDGEKKDPVDNPDAGNGMPSDEPYDLVDYTVVGVLDLNPVSAVHKVELLDVETAKPFDPPLTAMTAAGTGKFTIRGVPGGGKGAWIHVIGAGPASVSTSTYDSLSYGPRTSGETLIRISTVGTAEFAERTAAFKAKPDQIAIGGAVYTTNSQGRRTGAIGCAQIFLDNTTTLPTADGDPMTDDATDPNVIRYVGTSGLPLPLGVSEGTTKRLDKTLKDQGKFFIGNVSKGKHTFRASMDGGKTFIGEQELNIPFSRSEATGEFKGFLALFGIDVKTDTNPQPASCPAAE